MKKRGFEAVVPMRLLLADCGDGYIRYCADYLQGYGERVTICSVRTDEIIEAVERERPEMLVLDLCGGELDVYEISKRMRAFPEIRVVLLVPEAIGEEETAFGPQFSYMEIPDHFNVLRDLLRLTLNKRLSRCEQQEISIRKMLMQSGFSPKTAGFRFLCTAVCLQTRSRVQNERILYSKTAFVCGSSPQRVYRAIRRAIAEARENARFGGKQSMLPESFRWGELRAYTLIMFCAEWLNRESTRQAAADETLRDPISGR